MVIEKHRAAGIVLLTKLHAPRTPPDLVQRPHLLERLEAERTRPLTLVSAPAGYGKSIFIASWLDSTDWPAAWLSLDSNDGDLRRFLSYFVATLQKSFPGVCKQTQTLMQAAELPSVDTLATVLANELDTIDGPFVLVLDDYHRIAASSPVHDLLERLLANPPIPLHLVVISRLDPPLSLERYRALGQMSEFGIRDLRFGTQETRALIENIVATNASDAALVNLERELEGWVVGLRLLALALRQTAEPNELLQNFHGGTRDIEEYLISEVLNILPPNVREWLTRTALLDRFCAPLCETLCKNPEDDDLDGRAFLHAAQEGNLFLVPLDMKGEWFRYHHLFQELLQRELSRRLDPAAIVALHRRASGWFEQAGFIEEAIRHALSSGDTKAAEAIVARHRRAELNADNWFIVERWIEMLPPAENQMPDLLLSKAWIAYERFQLSALPALLDRVAGMLSGTDREAPLRGELLFLRGAVAYWEGDGEASQRCFAEALTLLTDEDPLFRGLLALLNGLSLAMCGEHDAAVDTLGEQMQGASSTTGTYFSRLSAGMFFTHLLSADLVRAAPEASRFMSVALGNESPYAVAWGSYMQALTHLQATELDPAARHFADALKQPYILHRGAAVDAFTGLALCRELAGHGDAATQALQNFVTFARDTGEPRHLELARSCDARLRLLRGDLAPALAWADGAGEAPESKEMFIWLEVPAITRARVWIAAGTQAYLHSALTLLDEVGARSGTWHFVNQSIEVDVLRSLAHAKLGRTDAAHAGLAQALELAAPGGWARPFVEAGPAIVDLLAAQDAHAAFVQHVLGTVRGSRATAGVQPATVISADTGMRESLTNREFAILELLAQRLQNKEIAARLFVSPETVKSHLKRLYQKLGVHNRRDAAVVANRLIGSDVART